MREIKFRAWDKVNSNMIYSPIWISDTYGERSGVIGLDGSVGLIFKSSRGLEIKEVKNQFILQQYTGLKDKNGKEIYEGDILEFTDKWEWYRSSYGIKMNFAGQSELKELQEKYAAEPMHRREVKFDPLEGYGLSKGDLEYYFEIIGNIYENPELLT